MATRRKKTRRRRNPAAASNPPRRRRRRSYRRNPAGLSARGIFGMATRGAIEATAAVGGKAGVRIISDKLGIAPGTTMRHLVEATAAVALAMVTARVSPVVAQGMLVGGFMSPIESVVKSLNVPLVSSALGDVDESLYLEGYDMPEAALSGYDTAEALLSGDSDDEAPDLAGYDDDE